MRRRWWLVVLLALLLALPSFLGPKPKACKREPPPAAVRAWEACR